MAASPRWPTAPSSPLSPYASADLKKYPLDLKRAEQLLDEAGLKKDGKGERMTLTVDYMPGSDVQGKNVAEYLRSQLKKVGIVVQVRASPDFPTSGPSASPAMIST